MDLNVTQVTNNSVLVDLKATVSSVKLRRQFGTGECHQVSSRYTETQVKLSKGEPFMIAGLLSEDKREQSFGIPFLQDIPFIGGFFRSFYNEIQQSDVVLLLEVIEYEC